MIGAGRLTSQGEPKLPYICIKFDPFKIGFLLNDPLYTSKEPVVHQLDGDMFSFIYKICPFQMNHAK